MIHGILKAEIAHRFNLFMSMHLNMHILTRFFINWIRWRFLNATAVRTTATAATGNQINNSFILLRWTDKCQFIVRDLWPLNFYHIHFIHDSKLIRIQLISVNIYSWYLGKKNLHACIFFKLNHDYNYSEFLGISLNANKTELIISRPKNKSITKQLNFRISGQKINEVKKTKYLGIYLDEHLTWNFQLSQIKTKLSRSCGLLAKLRYHVKTKLLRTVYFAIFESVLRYDPANPLFKTLKIMKLKDILLCNNCIFAHNQIKENLPENFQAFFPTAANQHNYNTRGNANKTIIKTTVNWTTYGLNSIKDRAASDWNQISKKLEYWR